MEKAKANRILELFGKSTRSKQNWPKVVADRHCPFLERLCLKNRKSEADVLIGTCNVASGKGHDPIFICPHRLLQGKQIFTDCFHLLTLHEPGNEYHIVPEVTIPGGSVDYCLASVRDGKVKDFVGIELQTLDTTGTVWPERQRFLDGVGIQVDREDVDCGDSFGMNWKMTAKTILMQLHHKIETFESINKHLVLVLQDKLLDYIRGEFAFSHVKSVRLGDAMHFHPYVVAAQGDGWQMKLGDRVSTDGAGVAKALGAQASAKMDLALLISVIEAKISRATRFQLQGGMHGTVDEASRTTPS